MNEAIESGYRTDVCKQTEFLTHSKKALLWTYLCRRVVIKLWITNAGKKNSISFLTYFECLLWEWVAYLINSMSTTEGFLVTYFVTELLCYSRHYSHTLLHNFWADTITSQYSNFQFHILIWFKSLLFNVYGFKTRRGNFHLWMLPLSGSG